MIFLFHICPIYYWQIFLFHLRGILTALIVSYREKEFRYGGFQLKNMTVNTNHRVWILRINNPWSFKGKIYLLCVIVLFFAVFPIPVRAEGLIVRDGQQTEGRVTSNIFYEKLDGTIGPAVTGHTSHDFSQIQLNAGRLVLRGVVIRAPSPLNPLQ